MRVEATSLWVTYCRCARKHARDSRHHRISSYICHVLQKKVYDVLDEPWTPTLAGISKPDNIVAKSGLATVLDITYVADNASLNHSHDMKVEYYKTPQFIRWVEQQTGCPKVTVEGAACNWRGAISQKSADSIRELGIKDSFLEILSARVVEEGFRIYSFFRDCTSRKSGAVSKRSR